MLYCLFTGEGSESPSPLYRRTAGAEEREETMQIKQNLFPGGVRRALTMSYDDGPDFDYRLVELFNRYGIRGTFHLNSGRLGKKDSVKKEDVASLYRHHEVSSHTVTHPFLDQIPDGTVLREILRDRRMLEGLCGYPVRGMSYPFGRYTEHAISLLRGCGIEYSRTVEATGSFDLPEDFDLMSRNQVFRGIRCCSFISGGTALSSTGTETGIRWRTSAVWPEGAVTYGTPRT